MGSAFSLFLSANQRVGCLVASSFLILALAPVTTAFGGALDAPDAHDQATAAQNLLTDFTENEIAADKKYGGRTLSVGGIVDRVGVDNQGDPYVILRPGPSNHFLSPHPTSGYLTHIRCRFSDGYTEKISRLRAGSTIAIRGRVSGLKNREVLLKDCSF